jgi:hypothetical protein
MERKHIARNIGTTCPCHFFTYQHTSKENIEERKKGCFSFIHRGISRGIPSLQKEGQDQSYTRLA